MPKTAVVILNWNGESLLKEFLPQVVKNTKQADTEIWVADNNSSDNSIEYVRKEFATVNILQLDQNYGYAGGYNRAIAQIESDYVVLLNSDAAPDKDWLKPLIDLMESDDNIAACAPKLKDYRNKSYFEYAGAAGGFIDKFGYVFCRGRIFSNIEKDEGQYDYVSEIFWATGAALFVHRDTYIAAGGLDEEFFAHMEEIDLCWRLKNQGKKIMYNPESVVYHLGGATLNKTNPQKTYLNFRNNLLMMYKNLPEMHFKSVMQKRVLLDYIAAFLMLLKFKIGDFKAVFRAHSDYKTMIKKSFKDKRRTEKAKVVKSSHNEIVMKGIVLLHFLGRVKRFSDIRTA
jgi:GT2 family glycosyltransferase